jgi:hypothetical protein
MSGYTRGSGYSGVIVSTLPEGEYFLCVTGRGRGEQHIRVRGQDEELLEELKHVSFCDYVGDNRCRRIV